MKKQPSTLPPYMALTDAAQSATTRIAELESELAAARAEADRLRRACQLAIISLDLANDDPTGKTYAVYVVLRDALVVAVEPPPPAGR